MTEQTEETKGSKPTDAQIAVARASWIEENFYKAYPLALECKGELTPDAQKELRKDLKEKSDLFKYFSLSTFNLDGEDGSFFITFDRDVYPAMFINIYQAVVKPFMKDNLHTVHLVPIDELANRSLGKEPLVTFEEILNNRENLKAAMKAFLMEPMKDE